MKSTLKLKQIARYRKEMELLELQHEAEELDEVMSMAKLVHEKNAEKLNEQDVPNLQIIVRDDMSKENLPQIVRENIFTKIVKWFKKIINKKVKNNVDFPQNKIINNTTKEDFISTIKVEENIKMKQKN